MTLTAKGVAVTKLWRSPKTQAVIDACPPHLRNQLADVLEYVGAAVTQQNGQMAEGNINRFLARQDPKIQEIIRDIHDASQTPRLMPFQDKATPTERYQEFGLDPQVGVTVSDAIDSLEVMDKLQARMGRDEPDESEPTTNELLSAAFDLHTQGAT